MVAKKLTGIVLATLISGVLMGAGPVPDNKKMIAIAVIDSGYSDKPGIPSVKLCKQGHADFSKYPPIMGIVPPDFRGHGTVVAHIISDSLTSRGETNFCLVIIKVSFNKGKHGEDYGEETNLSYSAPSSIKHILTLPSVQAVNISASGPDSVGKEKLFMNSILGAGIKVFVAAGNAGENMDETPAYPACYDRRITVVGFRPTKELKIKSNYGSMVNDFEDPCYKTYPYFFCGTSASTPIATYKWVLNKLLLEEGH